MKPIVLCQTMMSIGDLVKELFKVKPEVAQDILLRDIDAKKRNVNYVRVYDEFIRCSQNGMNFATALRFPLNPDKVINTI